MRSVPPMVPMTPIERTRSLLLAGAALTAEHLIQRHGPNVGRTLVATQVLLAIVYFGPHLSQAIAKLTGAQPFGLVLVALAVGTRLAW